jgi:hypothetical protein
MQNNPATILANARQHINELNMVLLQEPGTGEDDLRRYIARITSYSHGDLLRDVHLLETIWFNHSLNDEIRNQAATLLEQILGINPNTGILVEARALITRVLDRINQLRNQGRASAGGGKRKSRRTHNKNKNNNKNNNKNKKTNRRKYKMCL